MRTLSIICLLLSFVASSQAPSSNSNQEARLIITKMIDAINKHNQYTYVVNSQERIDGKLGSTEALFKYQYKPRKIYMKVQKPEDGAEILFGDGMFNGDALINPNGFPYINLRLDPEGWLMRKDHHHSLHDAGFHFICEVLSNSINSVGDNFGDFFKLRKDTIINGKAYRKLVIDVYNFEYKDYIIKGEENILDISDRLFLNDYLIVDKNEDIDDFDDVSAGHKIKLPNAYARKIVIIIDPVTNFPLVEEIHDEIGVYERYSFSRIKPSPKLSEEDFDMDNDDYGF